MDAQRSLNITIDDTSPIIRYQPLSLFNLDTVPDPLTGWSPICGAKTWVCDDHSAHTTSFDGAKFALSFFGTGIYLFGNVTSGMSYELTIDGNGVSNGLNGNNDTEPQMLARVSSLKPAVHTLTLVVKKGNSNGLFTFDYAQVIVDSATSFERTILNGTSSSRLTYGPAEPQYLQSWSSYGAYNATVPDGVDFNTFKASDLLGANVYTSFSGNTLLYYGPCYAASGAYTVTIDGSPNSQPVQLNASVPYTPPRKELDDRALVGNMELRTR
ncbi:hypothetical protein FS842_010219 [Serendipita sp. 407]|nr:hypothetical protein FS842_010219 [Serendipita sp. 407]